MSEWLQIRLATGPQQFETELGSVPVSISILWRDGETDWGWFVDIDGDDGTPFIHGVPLKAGLNILEGFEYLGLGELWAFVDGFDSYRIGFDDLGTTVDKLYWRA